MRAAQVAERIVWTFIAAALANVGAAAVLDIAVWKASVLAGLTAVANALTIVARWRLSVLPDPGDGLPGLEVSPKVGR